MRIIMEKVHIGAFPTKVHVEDEPNPENGACHKYSICRSVVGEFGHIQFQDGPIKENGVNGCQNEDLIAIVIHRLQGFQSGKFKCRENALALTKLEEALHWLDHRTADRENRGVEGTNEK